ncbi:hypothetical protein Tco_0623066 [Tanacetum coccineum]
MANLSKDMQSASSDTRSPMLDRSDFESWQQRIHLYCKGKDNGENILQSIDEGPFKMGKFRETLAEGALHLGLERDRVFADLTPEEKERYKADIRVTNILLQGLPKDIYTLINHYTDAKDIWDNVKMLLEVKLNRGLKTYNYDQLYAYLKQHEAHANENKMMLERYNQHAIDPLAFASNVSPSQVVVQNVQGRQNRGPGNNERGAVTAGNEGFQNIVGNANLDADYTSDSNIIPYDQYVKNNAEQVVQSCPMCLANEQNKVVNESLTAKLARYKEQVVIYEKRARFELTEREQTIYEQMRIIITGRNIKEEKLKRELHSVKMQLNYTIDHNKVMKEEVATLKKDFKQKENKYLEDFLDMKELKEKVEDKLFKQDQSLQTVHMLCKPKPFYDEKKKVAIGYKNLLYLTSTMQVQYALYNDYEIVKTNHAPAVVHDSEDTIELAEITRKRMLEKIKIPLWVKNKIKIAPLDYSKENYLATFKPQR